MIPIDAEPDPGATDLWSEWLLHCRGADDPAYDREVRAVIDRQVDHVLDAARLAPGMTLADLGSGEGLVAFRAIERVGPSLRVLLADLSLPMLRHAERLAVERGLRSQCTFVACAADRLVGIEDASIDAVTTRAVLAYVSDKRAALREIQRILEPGGRISIAEPIFRDEALAASALRAMLEAEPRHDADRFLRLLQRWKAAQFPDTEARIAASPIANFSERDLLEFVHGSGFVDIHVELHIDVAPCLATSWDVFLRTSPHPWAPCLGAILAEQFSADDRRYFEQVLRPAVESRQSVATDRIAFLSATKPHS